MKKMTLALLSGGASSEREVSLNGGNQVFEALDRDKYDVVRYDPKTDLPKLVADAPGIDAAVVILHGPYGEDGTIQGLLDLLGIPYQGSGVLGSAAAMNKLASKQLYEKAGLPVPRYIALRRGEPFEPDAIQGELRLPLVVKPVSCGSSIGMSIVRSPEDFNDAAAKAFEYDADVLVEAYIDGVELTGGVIGNDNPEALPLIEIIPREGHDFFDYDAKYVAGRTDEICPARVNADITRKAQSFARIAHTALYCKGYSRTDMILKGRDLYVLETNTIPGMTPTSLFPQAAAAAGLDFSALMDRLIELGIQAKQQSVI
jgi:D-alanine-D-alanine ligase